MEITERVVDTIVDMRVRGRLDGYWATHLDKTLARSVRNLPPSRPSGSWPRPIGAALTNW